MGQPLDENLLPYDDAAAHILKAAVWLTPIECRADQLGQLRPGSFGMLGDHLTDEVKIMGGEEPSAPYSAVIRCHDRDAPGWGEMVLGEVAASIACGPAAVRSRAGSR